MGGTFDPVHVGHVALAQAAVGCAGLDRLVLVPARTPPHKEGAAAAAEDRLEMCRLAVAGLERLDVSDVEVRRPGRSYTVDTLRQLEAAEPGAELHLVLGWDAARLLPTWREPQEVLRMARLVLFRRPGVDGPSPPDLAAAGIDTARSTICSEATPEVDATEIRRRAELGESLDGLVAPAVARYIAERGLYRRAHGDNRGIE